MQMPPVTYEQVLALFAEINAYLCERGSQGVCHQARLVCDFSQWRGC